VATGDVAGDVVVGDAMGAFGVEGGNVGDAMSELGVVVGVAFAVVGGAADITGAVTVGDDVGVVVVVGVDIVGDVDSCGAQHASICTRLASSLFSN
jgi:hypothetical protein